MPELLYKSAKWSEAELQAIRKEFAAQANDDQWVLFISQCERRNLEPGRHVVFGTRDSSKFDKDAQAWVTETKVTLITTVEALKLLAERTGKLKGIRPVVWYYATEGDDFKQSKIPLGRICHAASVEILRSDWNEPGFGVARYDACVQRKKPKANQTVGDPNSVWDKRGEEMTGKCAKADAFRNTFFEECGDLFIKEELQGSEPVTEKAAEPVNYVPVVAPIIPVSLPVNQTAAAVVADTRKPDIEELPAMSPVSTPAIVPAVTETMLSNMHAQAAMPEPPEDEPGSLLGDPEPPKAIPPAPEPPAPVVPPQANSVVPEQAKTASPAPAAATDDLPPGTTTPLFKAFTERCSKLVRDVLPKAGEKNGSPLLMAYISAKTGKKSLGEVTVNQWRSVLEALENAGNPQKALALIKAK